MYRDFLNSTGKHIVSRGIFADRNNVHGIRIRALELNSWDGLTGNEFHSASNFGPISWSFQIKPDRVKTEKSYVGRSVQVYDSSIYRYKNVSFPWLKIKQTLNLNVQFWILALDWSQNFDFG